MRSSFARCAALFSGAALALLGFVDPAQSQAPAQEPARALRAAPRLRFDLEAPRYYVQRVATRELRPQEGIHAPSEMTLDWSARRALQPGHSGGMETLRFRGLRTGARNRYGEWVEIDSRAPSFAAAPAQAPLRAQVERLLAHEFRARYAPSGELLAVEGAEELFAPGERHAQRLEELRSMLRLATPILPDPSVWQGLGTRWTYELRYLISNWAGGHPLHLRVEAEALAHEGDLLVVREKLALVGEAGREASGYTFREGRGELRFDLARGALAERRMKLSYGEPGLGAEYEVELRASAVDPFLEKR